jgi:hypothetical protein
LSLSRMTSGGAGFFRNVRATSPSGVSPSSCARTHAGKARTSIPRTSRVSFRRVGISVRTRSNKEASQTRDYCVAKSATLRAARPDPSFAQRTRSFRMTSKRPNQIVVRVSSGAQVTLANFSTRTFERKGKAGRALTKWKRNGRARPNFSPKLSTADPKTEAARLGQLLAAAETPSGPPQSPEPHNTDA